MTDDQPFRGLLIAAFLVLIPIGVYYRLLSGKTREPLDRRQEGVLILATLRPLGAACWLGLLAWMVEPAWLAWAAMPLPRWARWLGVAIVMSGCGLMVWTFRSLGPNLTDTVVTRRTHTLVLHGPYRWVRHPLYDAALLLTTGMSLVTGNWFLLVTGAAVFALLALRSRVEERNLLARFGDGYREYMKRTGRFLPARRSTRHAPAARV